MIQDNSEQIIKFIDNIEFSWEKKIDACVFFLSFLAGKFAMFNNVYVTYRLNNLKKMAHVY